MILIVSGPGGAGKGTLVARLLSADDNLWVSRSWTTRPRRDGEAESAYVFVDETEFQAKVDADGFLEWVEFLDYRQGSPFPDPPAESDTVFEIDVLGAAAVKAAIPDAISIFVDVPSQAVQRERLSGRGESSERIQQRLDKAVEERRLAAELGSVVVVNDDLDRAIRELQELISAARS